MPSDEGAVVGSAVKARVIQFAWFEYERDEDGIVFCNTMTKRLGARNILTLLGEDYSNPKKRKIQHEKDLEIEVFERSHSSSSGVKYQSLIAFPGYFNTEYICDWILNPGVENYDLVTYNTAEQADIIVFSGHGINGTVFGSKNPVSHGGNIDLGTGLSASIKKPRTGRMKYLFIVSCNNVIKSNIELWKPLFGAEKPLFGVFGYHISYAGGEKGAQAMDQFTLLIQKDPTLSILNAWMQANKKFGMPWAAFVLSGTENATMADLSNGNIDNYKAGSEVKYYNDVVPGGEVVVTAEPYVLRFIDSDGAEINRDNSNSRYYAPGQSGSILIKCAAGAETFKKGDVIRLNLFLYRVNHSGVRIDSIFDFDSSALRSDPRTGRPLLSLDLNANPWVEEELINGVTLNIQEDCSSVELKFTIKSDYKIYYKPTEQHTTDGSAVRGVFGLGMFLPNQRRSKSGAQPPVYAMLNGVSLCG